MNADELIERLQQLTPEQRKLPVVFYDEYSAIEVDEVKIDQAAVAQMDFKRMPVHTTWQDITAIMLS